MSTLGIPREDGTVLDVVMFHPGVHPGDAERARPALLYFHAGGQVLGSAHDAVGHPYCAPARATDLSGLPDTFIAAAQYDVFRDENIDFAQRLIAAGVPVDLHLYAHAFHAWDVLARQSALAKTFEHTWHDYLRRHLHS
ncbi:alpha/beta hydrolase fold domain-containing protein [Streptacidiphilus sp. N1-3]|uniref:Alpha/beta hydrolase fold domain-containing protein n=1 Tax=Streptacidiphilus alkalitolerans TaxID=3342712 RepID=A0ABV6X2L3_9ACTN